MVRLCYNKKDAAAMLSIHYTTLQRLVKQGQIKEVVVGGAKKIAHAELERFLLQSGADLRWR